MPPLNGRNGYRPCFTPGDLVAMAIIKSLVDDAGVKIGALADVAPEIFDSCNRLPWATVERSILVVELVPRRATFSSDLSTSRVPGTALVVSCGRIVANLRSRLLAESTSEPQQRLGFPPVPVARERRGR